MSLYAVAQLLFVGQWIYWGFSAGATKQLDNDQPQPTSWVYPLHLASMILGFYLLLGPLPQLLEAGNRLLLPVGSVLTWLGFCTVAAGVALAVFSRHTLGTNWSGPVQKREDQSLIKAGPYRRIRHPIYTAILMDVLGLWLMLPRLAGVVGLAIVAIAYVIKIRREEKFLVALFGDEYRHYQTEAGLLLPKF